MPGQINSMQEMQYVLKGDWNLPWKSIAFMILFAGVLQTTYSINTSVKRSCIAPTSIRPYLQKEGTNTSPVPSGSWTSLKKIAANSRRQKAINMKTIVAGIISITCMHLFTVHAVAQNEPLKYVNTFIGTDDAGNTFPGATLP